MTVGDQVRNYIETRLLNRRKIKSDDEVLFSNGAIDSLGVLELMAFLEKQFQVVIDTRRHELKEFDTVNRVVKLVERLTHENANCP